MHIPAEPNNDPDLIIGGALRAARKEIANLRAAIEAERGKPNLAVDIKAVAQLTAERDRLRAALETCKAALNVISRLEHDFSSPEVFYRAVNETALAAIAEAEKESAL